MKTYIIYDSLEVSTIGGTKSMDSAIKRAINYIISQGYSVNDFSYDEAYTIINVKHGIHVGSEMYNLEGVITIIETEIWPD